MNAATPSNNRTIVIALVVILVIVIAAFALNKRDTRTPGEKLGDAVSELGKGNGLDSAADQLKDRTPAQRVGDAARDAGDAVKDAAKP